MKILMATNTFRPHVGGVAHSVERFAGEFARHGHDVLILAPAFEGAPEHEEGVLRVPSLQKTLESNFAIPVALPRRIALALKGFEPDLVHSHHPFLLGDTALRVAASCDAAIVFTHHTMYEKYTHYVGSDSPRLRRFVIDLVTGYCNLCDAVISPSESVEQILVERGVRAPIEVIPTGVDLTLFASASRESGRIRAGIPRESYVLGHVGRLAPEKNLPLLIDAAAIHLRRDAGARLLIVGSGPSEHELRARAADRSIAERTVFTGTLEGTDLADAYAAMDVFVFTSETETQGLVLTESMAAGVPVVAVRATGASDLVRDGRNGRLVVPRSAAALARGVAWFSGLSPAEQRGIVANARRTAAAYSLERSAESALRLFESVVEGPGPAAAHELRGRFMEELRIVGNIAHAVGGAVRMDHRGSRISTG